MILYYIASNVKSYRSNRRNKNVNIFYAINVKNNIISAKDTLLFRNLKLFYDIVEHHQLLYDINYIR